MRSVRANDYWRRLKKRKLSTYIKEIDLNGHNGINKIELSGGIYCLCGLNGVGKSTVLAGIKDILGLHMSSQEYVKINNQCFTGKICIEGDIFECKNQDGERLVDKTGDIERITYLDFTQAYEILSFYYKQENLDELIEQSEENIIGKQDLEEINYLVGRTYKKISVYEFDDIYEFGTIPFFKVEVDDISYDTRTMGMGEHFLLYMYWAIIRCNNSSIILMEEPETFVGIRSQDHFMNILARICLEKSCSIVLTTHSPFIIEKVSDEKISIIGRASGLIGISHPKDNMTADAILGRENIVEGTIFVEDSMALEFLQILLEEECNAWSRRYLIEVLDSSGEVKKFLELRRTEKIRYLFIGVFDEDQKDIINPKDVSWPIVFLPVKKDVESEIRDFLSKSENVLKLATNIGKTADEVVIALTTVNGEDHHDWLLDLSNLLFVDVKKFLRIIYIDWRVGHIEEISYFLESLYNCEKR